MSHLPTFGPYPGDQGPIEDAVAALDRHLAESALAPRPMREALTATLTYLAVELTDAALVELVARAQLLPKRPIDAAALNAAQLERERR